MTLPPASRRAEIQAVERLYEEAFIAISLKTVVESLDLWQDVPAHPGTVASATGSWLSKVLKVVRLRRSHNRRIALAYYRLHRALWTGATIQSYEKSSGATEALEDLRDDFYKLVETLAPEAIEGRPKASTLPGDSKIKVEVIKDLKQVVDAVEDALEEIAETNLHSSASIKYKRLLDEVDTDKPGKEVDATREQIKTDAGSRAAATAQKSALDGARSTINEVAKRDKRVLGYVRVSKTGTPCYWCAMLISRGLIFYSSARSAQIGEDGEEYHTNCQCYALPVYSEEQFNSSDLFDLNRRYDKLWAKVTKGKRGKDAEKAWRQYFRDHPEEVSGAPGERPN